MKLFLYSSFRRCCGVGSTKVKWCVAGNTLSRTSSTGSLMAKCIRLLSSIGFADLRGVVFGVVLVDLRAQ